MSSFAQVLRNCLEAEGIDPDLATGEEKPAIGDDLRDIASDLEAKARWLRQIADKLGMADMATDTADAWRDVGGEG